MIIDCTMFHWEFDILELRMKEMWDEVDYFFVTESVTDFRGKERELSLSNNISVFDWASSKLIVNVSDKLKTANNTWDRETYQRNRSVDDAIKTLNPQPNDLLLISDTDEIFRPSIIRSMYENGGKYSIHMPMYYYYFNLFVHEQYAAKAVSVKHFTNAQDIRSGGGDYPYTYMMNGGWHFSYLGSPEQIKFKINTFSHDELDIPEFNDIEKISNAVKNHTDLFNRFGDNKFQIQKIDDTWPKTIVNNLSKYSHHIVDCSDGLI